MAASPRAITLVLVGDVMTGRGIDQVLPHPSPPVLYESYVKSALDYVALAERANGPIPRPVSPVYIWGDALKELDRRRPDVRIVNLETAVTRSDRPEAKGINYRMHPGNLPCLLAAGIDCCVLSNNHVLDWGREGLCETLEVLHDAGVKTAGAGRDAEAAAAPAVLPVPGKGRVLVYGFACPSSGVPSDWAATASRPGVNFLRAPSEAAVAAIAARIRARPAAGRPCRPVDPLGPELGLRDPARGPRFRPWPRRGRSRYRPRPFLPSRQGDRASRQQADPLRLRRFHQRLRGDREQTPYRDDLPLMYVVEFDADDHRLVSLEMVPFQIRRFSLHRAGAADAAWLRQEMDRQCRRLGGEVRLGDDLALRFAPADGRSPTRPPVR